MIGNTFEIALLISAIAGAINAQSVFENLERCTGQQQSRILPTLLECQPRDEVVHLDLPNETFVHVVPNHVTVKRCGGSSHNR